MFLNVQLQSREEFKKSGMDEYLGLEEYEYVARPLGITTNETSTGPVVGLTHQGTLKTLLKNFVLSPAMKTKVMWNVAKAMAFLHSKGFVHRALNLENVLCYSFDINDDVICK